MEVNFSGTAVYLRHNLFDTQVCHRPNKTSKRNKKKNKSSFSVTPAPCCDAIQTQLNQITFNQQKITQIIVSNKSTNLPMCVSMQSLEINCFVISFYFFYFSSFYSSIH